MVKTVPVLRTVTFECSCGAQHNSQDGKLPVGWTSRCGEAWCADCTRLGIPTRVLTAGGSPRRRRKAA